MKKKKILMIFILIVFLLGLVFVIIKINHKSMIVAENSSNSQENKEEIIEITDNYFIEQTNDIFLNINEYVGKTVRMQGIVYPYTGENGITFYAVVRNTPRMLPEMMAWLD